MATVVQRLSNLGLDPSFNSRQSLYQQYGLGGNFSGTAQQNLALAAEAEKRKAAPASVTPTPTSTAPVTTPPQANSGLPKPLSYDEINQQLQPALNAYTQKSNAQIGMNNANFEDLSQRLRQQNTLDTGSMLTNQLNGNQLLSGGTQGQQAFLNQQTQNQLNRADYQRVMDNADQALAQSNFNFDTGSQLGKLGQAQQGIQLQQQQAGVNQAQVLNDVLKNPFLHYLKPETAQALLSSLGVSGVSAQNLISGMPDPNSFLNTTPTSPTPTPPSTTPTPPTPPKPAIDTFFPQTPTPQSPAQPSSSQFGGNLRTFA